MRSSKAADRVPQDQAATVRFLGGGQRSHVVLTHQPRRSWRGRPARPSRGRGQELADRPGSEERVLLVQERDGVLHGDGSSPVHTWSWAAGRAGLAPLSGGSVAPALALGGAGRRRDRYLAPAIGAAAAVTHLRRPCLQEWLSCPLGARRPVAAQRSVSRSYTSASLRTAVGLLSSG